MADNNDVKFKLSLEITEFLANVGEAKDSLTEAMATDSSNELIENVKKLGLGLGVAGAAALAFKTAFDLIEEGEQVKKINEQFEILANQAGISAEVLKNGLEASAKGLVDNDNLLKIANQSMIALGASSTKLPDILEMSRKAASLFGKDVNTVFQDFTTALANGNVRMLKQYNLQIDQNKAIEDFARANGVAVETLSQFGKNQAVLNAVLDEGKKRYAGVNEDLNNVTSNMQRLKVAWTEFVQQFAVLAEKYLAPAANVLVKGLTSVVNLLTHLKAPKFDATATEFLKVDESAKKTEEQLKQTGKAMDLATGADPQKYKQMITNQDLMQKANAKFQDDMTKAAQAASKLQEQSIEEVGQIEQIVLQQREIAQQMHENRIKQIRQATYLDTNQKKAEIAAEDARFTQEVIRNAQQEASVRRKLLDEYQKHSKSTFDGIARAYKATVLKNNAANADFGAQGQLVMNSFQTNSTMAFQAVGAAALQGANVAGAAAKAIGASLLAPVADFATAQGSALLLSGLWPPNPVALAAGAGLVALGGALKSLSGGLISSMAPSAGGGGGAGGGSVSAIASNPCPVIAAAKSCPGMGDAGTPAPGGTGTTTAQDNLAPNTTDLTQPQKQVNVHIAGNYFDTDASRTALMDIIRQSTDATDFNYYKLGVGK